MTTIAPTDDIASKVRNGEAFYNVYGEFVELEKSELLSPTLVQRIELLEKNQRTIVKALGDWNNVLSRVIANTNEIYPQLDVTYNDNKIHIRASKTIINSTSVIYVLPIETIEPINEDEFKSGEIQCQLIVHTGTNTSISLAIVKEDYNGNLVALNKGDIVANRLAMFRTAPNDNSKIILVNASVYGNVNIHNLTAVNATFINNPTVQDKGVILATSEGVQLMDELDQRYQKKPIVSTEPISQYKGTLETGQMYIQVESKVDEEDL